MTVVQGQWQTVDPDTARQGPLQAKITKPGEEISGVVVKFWKSSHAHHVSKRGSAYSFRPGCLALDAPGAEPGASERRVHLEIDSRVDDLETHLIAADPRRGDSIRIKATEWGTRTYNWGYDYENDLPQTFSIQYPEFEVQIRRAPRRSFRSLWRRPSDDETRI